MNTTTTTSPTVALHSTNYEQPLAEEEPIRASKTERPRRIAAHIDIGEAFKEPAILRQSMSAIPPERAMKRLAGIDDNDGDGPPIKRLIEDTNDYSRATSTTTQLSKKPKLAKSPKRRSDDDDDGLEQSSLKRRRSNRVTFGSATNTNTNDPPLPNFTKATKRRASTYDETETQRWTAKRQKLTTPPDCESNVSMTQQSDPATLSDSMDGDVNEDNYFKKSSLHCQSMDTAAHKGTKNSNETLQTLKRRSRKQASTIDNAQAQNSTPIAKASSLAKKIIDKTNQALEVQGHHSETAGKVRRLALECDNERAPIKKGQTQMAAPGSGDHAAKSSLTTVKLVKKQSPRFVARRRNVAKSPSAKCKSFISTTTTSSLSYSKPATECSVIAEPGDLEKTQSHTDTSSHTTTARGQGIPGETSIKAPISLANTPRIIGIKLKYQDAPAGGHGKRQRVNSEQSETVPPRPFLERLPREVRLDFI
ncbi:hypothetical protein E2P81_ATG02543 [Venturia nashicola]|nr:hypothetical protein E2P81_ATG02543 [Venturia nashicola]